MYRKTIKELYLLFETKKEGLSSTQVTKAITKYGENVLKAKEGISPWKIFLNQFNSFIVWILIGAVIISAAIAYFDPHESYIEAVVIGIILFLNAILGFIQEFRAEKSIQALKHMTALQAKVWRNNKVIKVEAKYIVPGDIILLEAGDKVPADARIIEANDLEAMEAALTGESTPVRKEITVYTKKLVLGDQKNMVFSSTNITRGNALAVVVATGMRSEIGKIATLIDTQETKLTPLQIQLAKLGKRIGIITLAICAIVFGVGLLKGGELKAMFITAISLAVAAIPEGLPAVVTISLALGVKRMISKNALIRKLPSVETLGSTTIICSDKTGTLTHNQMTVTKLYTNKKIISVTGKGYNLVGTFSEPIKNFQRLLEIGTLCNDSTLSKNDVIGDPTEGCLLVSAAKAKINKTALEKKYKRLKELPFDSERKMMTTLHQVGRKKIAFTKGAPDEILKNCNRMELNGKVTKLTKAGIIEILHHNDKFAQEALRVLAFAYKEVTSKLDEKNLIFVGLQAMIDPPREEVKDAIKKCHSAGIKVAMITGDHITTAKAIATELGINGRAITGEQLDTIKNLEKEVESIAVYARVNPEHKLRIVQALQKNGHIVAMTGDGVNDAPALKSAEIGVAMGITGTEVAKESAEMILTDDNFTSIVAAVEEGRGIYANIKKFVYYLLSSNMGEVLTLLLAIIIGFKANGELLLPLIATQLLWMNLVTDGLPALALGVSPTESTAMTQKPRARNEHILSTYPLLLISLTGIVMMLGTLFIFNKFIANPVHAQTMAFTTLMIFQMFNVLTYVSEARSIFSVETIRNKWLWVAITTSVALQLVVIYIPIFNTLFSTTPLAIMDWAWILIVSSSVLLVSETIKLGRHFYAQRA